MTWADVEKAIPKSKAIAFDGCHKIYLLLDDEQVALSRSYGYGDEGSFQHEMSEFPDSAAVLARLHKWFDESCGLRFINSISTNKADPNAGFTGLIEQFELEDEEEDDGSRDSD